MLTNSIYIGYINFPKWEIHQVKGVHVPIISEITFNQVKERIEGKIPVRTNVDMKVDFPLRGYVNCKYCHHPFTASWSTSETGKKHAYYRCISKNCTMKGKSIAREKLHSDFEDFLLTITPTQDMLSVVKKQISIKYIEYCKSIHNEITNQQSTIKSIEEQISILISRITNQTDEIITKIYEAEISKLCLKKDILISKTQNNKILSVEELERTVEKILKNLHNPKEIWQSQSYENKVMLQKMYFNENIEYSKNELFGTPEKCYILRFFEQIGSKNTQNFSDVDSRRFELLTSSVQVRRSTN